MTNHRERISGVDTAWLRMDDPTNPMMIVGVMTFEGRLSSPAVKRVIRERFLSFRRFACRAAMDATGAWWEETRVDLNDHVKRVRLPGAAGKAELEALVSDLASTPLERDRPLWQFHLVENYAGGSALVARIHHCYADGIALIQVMLSLTHESAAGSLAVPDAPPVPAVVQADGDFWEQMLKPLSGVLGSAGKVGRGIVEQGRGLVANPQAAGDAVQELAKKGMDFAAEVARLALMGQDSPTRFKGPLGTRKRVAWAEPLPLAEVKVMGKALGCSINDVLLSFAAGALRDYLEERGDPTAGLEIRAVVPVNLRPLEDARNLGNHFGMVFLELPVGLAHPLERLYEVRQRMKALKGSYQPIIALGLLNAVGYGPRAVQEQVTALLGASASAVMTNVPGPQQPLYFAGKRIADIDFWVPQSGGIGMGVSILSYDGRIHFGVITDEGLVPDPASIVARFGDEFEKLLWLTLMSPWGEEAALQVAPDGATADAAPAKAAKTPRRRKGRIETPEAVEAAVKVPKRFRNL
jgi:diacylglycerol O-acyltransferase / wax synthase